MKCHVQRQARLGSFAVTQKVGGKKAIPSVSISNDKIFQTAEKKKSEPRKKKLFWIKKLLT